MLETEFSRAEQTEKEYKTQKQTTEKDVLPIGRPAWNLKKKKPFTSRNERSFKCSGRFSGTGVKGGVPVSGLRFHGASFPCKLEKEHQNLTKEMIEELVLQAEQLRGKQEQAAAAAEAAGEPSGRKTEKCRGKF